MNGSVKSTLADMKRFFSTFMRSPKQVGSIAPSSPYLTRAMLEGLDWNEMKTIVEFGAGTGVFTKKIAEKKQRDTTAIIFEQDSELRAHLSRKFPQLLFRSQAQHLKQNLAELGLTQVDGVVSGLPFANFPHQLRNEILDGVEEVLKPGGVFITFQYSLQMKKQLQRRFPTVDISYVPLNLPPAVVYLCHKQAN